MFISIRKQWTNVIKNVGIENMMNETPWDVSGIIGRNDLVPD